MQLKDANILKCNDMPLC